MTDTVAISSTVPASETAGAGRPVTLRWVLANLLEEYVRHNGHADLLRMQIDGAVGI